MEILRDTVSRQTGGKREEASSASFLAEPPKGEKEEKKRGSSPLWGGPGIRFKQA